MADHYDLVVIGSGTAAQSTISALRNTGWRMAVIDHKPFGGTCALRGCDPKKMLVSGEEAIDAFRRMNGNGVDGDVHIAWPDLIAFKRTFTDPIPAKQSAHYAELGVEALRGSARFTSSNTVDVDGQSLSADHILIATGAAPVPLKVPGEELVITSDTFMNLSALPRRIVFIGGGYIAAEFSHLAARAGAEVTILQRAPTLLTHFDPDLVSWLMPSFEALGISVRTEAEVTAVERSAQGVRVRIGHNGTELPPVEADLVVHAAGRAPDLSGLDLKRGNVAHHQGRLKLTPFLQSVSNLRIYAAGDAAGVGPPLTPVSSHDGKVVAANMCQACTRKPDYKAVPSVCFTIPPIASVGLNEREAADRGVDVRVNSASTPGWFTARRLNAKIYGHKVLIEKRSDRIVGAHLVGPGVEEVINLFALAIRHEMTADQLKSAIFAYPTGASDIGSMV